MASEDKIREGARPFMQEGEEVLAAFVARPRGWTQANAGSMHLGLHQQGKSREGADAAGFALASPMALAITGRRLLSFSMGAQAGMGIGGGVKELVGEAPLGEQRPRDREADPLRRAGDDGDLMRELEVHGPATAGRARV